MKFWGLDDAQPSAFLVTWLCIGNTLPNGWWTTAPHIDGVRLEVPTISFMRVPFFVGCEREGRTWREPHETWIRGRELVERLQEKLKAGHIAQGAWLSEGRVSFWGTSKRINRTRGVFFVEGGESGNDRKQVVQGFPSWGCGVVLSLSGVVPRKPLGNQT